MKLQISFVVEVDDDEYADPQADIENMLNGPSSSDDLLYLFNEGVPGSVKVTEVD